MRFTDEMVEAGAKALCREVDSCGFDEAWSTDREAWLRESRACLTAAARTLEDEAPTKDVLSRSASIMRDLQEMTSELHDILAIEALRARARSAEEIVDE